MGIVSSVNSSFNPYNEDSIGSSIGSADIVQSILSTNWDLTDDFEVIITNIFVPTIGKVITEEDIKKSIISVEIPAFSARELGDNIIGGQRRIQVGLYEAFRFSIRLRDFDGGMLRKYFTAIWVAQQELYLDEIKTTVEIRGNGGLIFKSEDCLITQVTGSTYDNTTTNASEITVNFFTPTITTEEIKDFGKDPEYPSNLENIVV
jgi:hypothetical protein